METSVEAGTKYFGAAVTRPPLEATEVTKTAVDTNGLEVAAVTLLDQLGDHPPRIGVFPAAVSADQEVAEDDVPAVSQESAELQAVPTTFPDRCTVA